MKAKIAGLNKVIKYSTAQQIARAISRKAFEHLLKPLYNKEHEFVQKVHDELLAYYDLTPTRIKELITARIATDNEICEVTFDIADLQGDRKCNSSFTLGLDFEQMAQPRYYNVTANGAGKSYPFSQMTITNAKSVAGYLKHEATIQPYREQINQLYEEIYDQVIGRTAGTALEAWPEASTIIAEACELKITPMVVPLEQLLAKFLALPAPAAVGA